MTNYVDSIRKYIGHERLLIVGASVIVHANGRLLLQRRKDNGCWGYHGGGLELGETAEEAARRELTEETGLTALSLQLIGVFSGKDLMYTYPNGDMVSIVDVVYLCGDFAGEMIAKTSETTDLHWFSLDELPENISPPIKPALARCVEVLRDRTMCFGECEPRFYVEIAPCVNTIRQFVAIIQAYGGGYFTSDFADSVAIDAPYQQLCYLCHGDGLVSELISGIMFTVLDGCPHITAMATKMDCKDKGYGKRLMEHFAQYVARLGFSEIELYAWSEKTKPICAATQAFYKSVGFVVVGEHMGLWEKDIITVKMRKSIRK